MKKTWLLALVATMMLIVAACSKDEEQPSDVDANSSTPPESLTLGADVTYDAETKKLSATVSMTNPNEEPVKVTFNSSQRFNMVVKNEDETVFDYGSERMFTESIIEETWAAGETKVFDEVVPVALESGEYTVEFVSLAQTEGAPEVAVTEEKTFSVEAAAPTPTQEPAETPSDDSSEEPVTETPSEEPAEEPSEQPSEQPAQSSGQFRDVAIKLSNEGTLQVTGYTDVEEFEWSVSDGHTIYAQGASEVTSGGFTFGGLLSETPAEGRSLILEMTPIGGEVSSFRIQ